MQGVEIDAGGGDQVGGQHAAPPLREERHGAQATDQRPGDADMARGRARASSAAPSNLAASCAKVADVASA